MKRIILLGATGSIGSNTLQVVREHRERLSVVGLVAHSNDESLLRLVREFRPEAVCLVDAEAASRLRKNAPRDVHIFAGEQGVSEVVKWPSGDMLVAASSGSTSLLPVLEAIGAGKQIAVANKEILVMAGRIVTEAVRKHQVPLLPIDSEHNAIFQCLQGSRRADIKRILLTGSGGPLKDLPSTSFKGISKEVVMNHPRWSMGRKVTVDSATLMNKGLEMIEAHWFFGVAVDRIKVLVHPEAVVHSMVEFVDGSIIAQLGPTDMKSPILHVLSYPERWTIPAKGIDLIEVGNLRFSEPDSAKFPCLGLAMEVAKRCDSTLPCVLNAADEVAVGSFLEGRMDFTDIPRVIERVLKAHRAIDVPALSEILSADRWAREEALHLCGEPEARTVC